MKRIILLFAFILPAVLLKWTPEGLAAPAATGTLRISVIDNKAKVYLVIKGPYKICAVDSDKIFMEGPRLRANVTATKTGIMIGKKEIAASGVEVKPYKDSDIYIDWKRFRGGTDIMRREGEKLSVINEIDIEDYLYGVLYHEVSHRWPMEVLKAQAIAARTFALYQKAQNKSQPYDLRNDIYSQVYGGRNSERWATTKAVNLTKGKVLTYDGRIFPAYYHATCAGHTEDASNLWNIDLPPLKGTACDFCKKSPHYRWTKEIGLWSLKAKLKDAGYTIGRIESVTVLSKNVSVRAEKIEIKDESGTSVIMTAKEFRQMIGPNEVRSTNFETSVKWNKLRLRGSGWGHGVGMCQWGAYGMARKGKRAEEILAYYYPGTEITTIDKVSGGQ